MKVEGYLVLLLVTLLQYTWIQGEFTCFKKYRPKLMSCGGPSRRKSLTSPEKCCKDYGQGFTEQILDKVGKNKYTCTSCSEWERQKNSIDSGGTPGSGSTPTPQTEGFNCFRKYRRRQQQCGGPMRISKVSTIQKCCMDNRRGFTTSGLTNHGKNKYTCMSCDEWKNEQEDLKKNETLTTEATITTPAPSIDWGPWGSCNTTCGIGWRSRYRICPTCQQKLQVQSEPCIIQYYCPVDGNWGNWMTWTSCTASCSGGIKRRERFCNNPPPMHGGKNCVGSELDEQTCSEQPCEIDGQWSHWTRFGACSQTCGRGEMIRTRKCDQPEPTGGGRPCRGRSVEARRCEARKCPLHGGWSSWEQWSDCPVTCGEGQRSRSRECNRPRPLFGGNPCAGSEIDTETCTANVPCPIHGGWSDWSEFGSCRAKPCTEGHRIRTRVCDNPRPRYRGHMCRGRRVEKISCMNEEGCAVDGGWCDYSIWTPCSATCIGTSAAMSRRRACYCPAPQNGGKSCQGDHIEIATCNGTEFCPHVVPAV
ncbi:hypothetical protein ACF0H5_014470 [Mactra antiquata]